MKSRVVGRTRNNLIILNPFLAKRGRISKSSLLKFVFMLQNSRINYIFYSGPVGTETVWDNQGDIETQTMKLNTECDVL